MPNLAPYISRRAFLEFGAAAWLSTQESRAANWTPPPTLKNPNILVVMVDQMRLPTWLSPAQSATLAQTLPNIAGRLFNNSFHFGQFYAAANNCTPARAALLTGLYAPQTAIYITSDAASPSVPSLDPAYPTWGEAIASLNPAYRGKVWWFGKWHLSTKLNSQPLLPFGFRTRTIPGGSRPFHVDPVGVQNEGTDGTQFHKHVWANDALIAGDFTAWLQAQSHQPARSEPWCATVSFVNPHDITFAPAWLQSNPFPPAGPLPPVYFPPPSGSPPSFYTGLPSPWNLEDVSTTPHKPPLQQWFLEELNLKLGPVKDWVLFLNQYFWLQNFVDQQVGAVLDAVQGSPFADNTVVVFLADHGEYAGSHGLHAKGCAVYDEAIHVPLCVQFPGQTSATPMNQMCSAVDFFGLLCDLATGGGGQWQSAYPDLAQRQSLWNFLYQNSAETRVAPAPIGLPYIFHTYDGTNPSAKSGAKSEKSHIVCLRTTAAKLAFYTQWAQCTIYPNHKPADPEFYDYSPETTGNTAETGNDYFSANAAVQKTIAQYKHVLGKWGPPETGLIAAELNPPLTGAGTDGNPLSEAQAAAQQAYYAYAYGSGTCPA